MTEPKRLFDVWAFIGSQSISERQTMATKTRASRIAARKSKRIGLSRVRSAECRRRCIVTVRPKGQITLTASIRKAVRLDEGDPVSVELTPEGILLRPMKLIETAQTWFWTKEWQEGERQADRDIAEGRTTVHKSGADLLSFLGKR